MYDSASIPTERMQISRKSELDRVNSVSNGLLINLDGRKWDWLTLQAIFSLLISLELVANAAVTPAYPLKPSANGRYVVDSNNVPFLIIGDAPHDYGPLKALFSISSLVAAGLWSAIFPSDWKLNDTRYYH